MATTDPIDFEDEIQARIERLVLQSVKPARIAKAVGLDLPEVHERIKKVEADLAASVKMTGPERVFVLFGQLVARSKDRYNKLMVLHDLGGEELGCLKAAKEEDKYMADLLARPIEAAKALGQPEDPADDYQVSVSPLDDSDEIPIPFEEGIIDYDVLQKATVIGRGTEISA